MTPKEKAEELFGKYATYVVMWKGDINTTHQNCKQCALIAVDLVIYSFPTYPSEVDGKLPDSSIEELIAAENYWNDVKAEIEKL